MCGAFRVAEGKTIQQALTANPSELVNGFLIEGLISMERGYIFTCMILAAMSACLVDRKFYQAAIWSTLAAVGTFIGLMHTFELRGNLVDSYFPFFHTPEGAYLSAATGIGIGYVGMAIVCVIASFWRESADLHAPPSPKKSKKKT